MTRLTLRRNITVKEVEQLSERCTIPCTPVAFNLRAARGKQSFNVGEVGLTNGDLLPLAGWLWWFAGQCREFIPCRKRLPNRLNKPAREVLRRDNPQLGTLLASFAKRRKQVAQLRRGFDNAFERNVVLRSDLRLLGLVCVLLGEVLGPLRRVKLRLYRCNVLCLFAAASVAAR